ncbi:MAG: type VI secretion system lipoprotein TssJ [Planctomycetota bacterium]
MTRAKLLLPLLLLPFAACSGVKTYELGLHGAPNLNPNEEGQANAVRVKVMCLVGEESAKAFEAAAFDDLWADLIKAQNIVLNGPAQSQFVPPRDARVAVTLKEVPLAVTHIGVVGLFNAPLQGKDRCIIGRDAFGSLELWLHDNVIDTAPPTPAPTPAPAPKQPGS